MDRNTIFTHLKSYLAHYEPRLAVLHNKSDNYYLITLTTETIQKPEFFVLFRSKNLMWHFT